MKIINKIVHSSIEPEDHYVYWFDEKSNELKYFYEGDGWTPVIETLEIVENVRDLERTVQEFMESGIVLQDKLESLENQMTKDVSLFATTQQGNSYDSVFVKAPVGVLKETDQVIFARYITNKTRPRVYGETDKSTPRKVYRGWIKPAKGEKRSSTLLIPDDKLKLEYHTTIDGYDHFYLGVDPDGVAEELLFYLWNYAYIDDEGNRHPRVKDKKLGIKIMREGETIVDYLPFTVKVDQNGNIHFGRL